jgi:predicted acetyltransferase
VTLSLRPAGDAETGWPTLVEVDALAFGSTPETENEDRLVMEMDRTVIAWDGDQAVGCAASFTFDLSLPGGSAPTAGVTWVGVVPTHRRRGVMSRLMADRHHEALAAGEPLAALWASQSAIYPRFGYGAASHSLQLTIPHSVPLARTPPADDLDLSLVASGDDGPMTRPVYAAARAVRPGMPAQDDRWHARAVSDRPSDRDGWGPLRTFVATRDGEPVAYARFRQKHRWDQGIGEGTVRVQDLVAIDPAGAAAVWQAAHRLESMAVTRAWNVPLDDPVLLWLSEIRSVEMRMREQLYVRVLDLPAALTARTYATEVDVVLDVTDDLFPDNARRWRLSGGPAGATCAPTQAAADLALDIRAVGAALLGSTSLRRLAAAGDVDEQSAGALDAANIAFGHGVAAWCPWVF